MRVKVIWCNGPTNLLICNIEPCIGWVDNFAPYLMSVHIICMGLIGAVSNFATKNGWFMIICPIRSLTLGILLYFRSWDKPRYALKPHISKKKNWLILLLSNPIFPRYICLPLKCEKLNQENSQVPRIPIFPWHRLRSLGRAPPATMGKFAPRWFLYSI